MKCQNCGAEIDKNLKVCQFCGSEITVSMMKEREQLNKAGCPKCGSSNITFNREKQGEVKGKNGTVIVRSTVGMCKDCGYTWRTEEGQKTKGKTWLWVLGWVCIFPIPLTIIILRQKDMKPAVKYGIIAAAWITYLIIGLFGGSGDSSTTSNSTTNTSTSVEQNVDVEKSEFEFKNALNEGQVTRLVLLNI